jgi:sirohydrochlorin ferrochelatase
MRDPQLSPLVLVAHGSPDPRSAAMVRRIAGRVSGIAAFLDFDDPHPVEALHQVADTGHSEAVMVPLLLTRAHHGRVDIPRVAERVARSRPGLSVRVTDTVGGCGLLPALTRSLPDCDGVVLAAAGTRDSGALRGIERLAQRLGQDTGLPCLTGFASAADPGPAEAVARLRRRGATRVAVASYFIAPGTLHDRVTTQALAAGAIAVTPPLGDCPELAGIIDGYRSPTDSRVDGAINSATVAMPSAQAGTANHHRPALAR